jgi:ribonuclease D
MARAPAPITGTEGAAEVAAEARAAGRVALDLEFLWERTYRPQACLAQVAVGDDVHLVDPLAGASLEPLAELVADPDVTVVMHAPSADLTLLALSYGVRPARLVDTQLAAGFVGLGAGQSLGALLERALGVRLRKSESYTDWSRRPLTPAQLAYAVDDVRHLVPLADELDRRAATLGRSEWVVEEHRRRYGPEARVAADPDEAWRRVRGQGRLSPEQRAVLRRVAAWREREAMRRDRPVQWTLPDRTAIELARRRPTDAAALRDERGVPDRLRGSDLDGLAAAIAAAADDPPLTLAPPTPARIAARLEVLGPLGQVLVSARAAAASLAAPLVATREEIESFLLDALDGGESDHPLGRGWRRELVGSALLELAAGRLALAPAPREPFLEEIARGPAGAPE